MKEEIDRKLVRTEARIAKAERGGLYLELDGITIIMDEIAIPADASARKDWQTALRYGRQNVSKKALCKC